MLVKRKPNDLIPKFLDKFDVFSKEVQTRLKLSAMLNEFNDKLNKNFLSFVNLSNSRYKSVKSGNALDSILCNQKMKYNLIAEQIMADDFYHNEDIQNEKEKIEKNINNRKKTEELKEIRDKIKQSAQDMLASNQTPNKSNSTKKGGVIANFKPYGNNTRREKKHNMNQANESVCFNEEDRDKKVIKRNAQFVNEIMKEDEKLVSNEINDYVKHLDLVKKEAIQGEDKKIIKLLNDHKKFFLTDKIKMLNYQEEDNQNVIKKKPKDISIDIKKVMKYTKRGKRMNWALDYPGKLKSSTPSKDTRYATSYHPNLKTEISDTINLVKTEAENCLFIDEKFYQKRNQLNKYISDEVRPLPLIVNTDHNMQNSTFKTKNGNMQNNFNNTQRGGNMKNIDETFKTVYNAKTQEWKKEDFEREELDKIKAEELKHTYNFLKEVKNQPRKLQLYVDGYSSRNQANENIMEFSKALGRRFYNKRKINREINHYITEKEAYNRELEEQIRQKHEELIREAELEEERKKAMFDEFKQRIKDEEVCDDDSVQLGENHEVMKPFKNFNPSSTGYDTDDEYEKFIQFKKQFVDKIEKSKKKQHEVNNLAMDPSERRSKRLVTFANRPNKTSVLNLDSKQLMIPLKKQLSKKPDSRFMSEPKSKSGIEIKIPNAASCNYINYKHLT